MSNKRNLILAGFLILGAVIYLIVTSTSRSAGFFLTIEELQALGTEAQHRNSTVSGAVLGESIRYEPSIPRVTFTMVQVPGDPKAIEAAGGLAKALHDAVNDPTAARLDVVYHGLQPDLLTHEAQAIVRGRLQADGVFYAEELLLKCPSRYVEDLPQQVED